MEKMITGFDKYLVDVRIFFSFFRFGEGKGSPRRNEVGGVLIENPRGGSRRRGSAQAQQSCQLVFVARVAWQCHSRGLIYLNHIDPCLEDFRPVHPSSSGDSSVFLQKCHSLGLGKGCVVIAMSLEGSLETLHVS